MAVLQAAGVAQAADEQLDLAVLAERRTMSEPSVREQVERLDRAGLLLLGTEDTQPPILLNAGRQCCTATPSPTPPSSSRPPSPRPSTNIWPSISSP
ncbi:MAG: hypothetical protein ABSH51_30640, partial [Solirubrobacteraceae bacterium]